MPSLATLTPQDLARMPAARAHAFAAAYAQALPPIFLYLVPVLGVGFVLSFFLVQKRLRTTAGPQIAAEPLVFMTDQ